jgi:hypothetical protein
VQYKRVKSGGVFIPDTAHMTITMDQAVQTVHKPVRSNCLQCHAKAGGGDAYKRGDITLAHGNTTDTTFDRHMAIGSGGSNLQCQSCHKVSNHRIAGRGSDLAPTDYDFPMGCSTTECHTTKGSPAGHTTQAVNRHIDRVACQTCHIRTYGKNASDSAASEATEYHRDWSLSHFNSVTGLWHPTSYLMNNLIPIYRFWNKYSTNYLLYDVTARNPLTGNYTTSKPIGTINDLTTASKLYPFKYKTAYQPIATNLKVLIAVDTSVYWATGNYLAAVAAGIANMGFSSNTPYTFVNTETNQLITHGVPPAAQVLTCNECHGSTAQMNLPNIGYQLKNSRQMVCTQCHGWEDDQMGFVEFHQKHVQEERQGCSWCHNFSRPERQLNENYQTYLLTVSKPGTGNGTVTSVDEGISCGTDCTQTYGVNTLVTLMATPALGAKFRGWSGVCEGKNTTCNITMSKDSAVTAVFDPILYKLTVVKKKVSAGDGAVTSTDGVINCGNICGKLYDKYTQVTLTATPAANSVFAGWSGACSGTGACDMTIDKAKTVRATFTGPQKLTVRKQKIRKGDGTVTSQPPGIDCATTCTASYPFNQQVSLTATPAQGSTFTRWNPPSLGCGGNPCIVTMDRARVATAVFTMP